MYCNKSSLRGVHGAPSLPEVQEGFPEEVILDSILKDSSKAAR